MQTAFSTDCARPPYAGVCPPAPRRRATGSHPPPRRRAGRPGGQDGCLGTDNRRGC
jgi:hypothetical protein